MSKSVEEKPVLATLRKLIEVSGQTTVSEIVKFVDLPNDYVLDVLHKNLDLIKKSSMGGGVIIGDTTREVLAEHLRSKGAFWHIRTIMHGSESILVFDGQPDLFEELSENRSIGSYGGTAKKNVVMNTEENRARLREEGMVSIEEVDLTDELWKE